jgi:hypothetical protein
MGYRVGAEWSRCQPIATRPGSGKGARLIFLPPYSPDFSSIEPFWSKVKDILKPLGPRTYQALKEAIDIAHGKVSLNDIRN